MFTPQDARKLTVTKKEAENHCGLVDDQLRRHALNTGFIEPMQYTIGQDRELAEALRELYADAGWSVAIIENGPDRAYESYNNFVLKFLLPES